MRRAWGSSGEEEPKRRHESSEGVGREARTTDQRDHEDEGNSATHEGEEWASRAKKSADVEGGRQKAREQGVDILRDEDGNR